MSTRSLPSLPLKVMIDEAKDMIQEQLDENNWGEKDVPTPTVELVPYFVFHYDAYSETEEEKSKIRNVNEARQGESSLNGVLNTLDDVTAELAPLEVVQSEFMDPQKISVSVKNPRFTLDEAKAAAQIKVAAQEKVPRANVHISGMRLVYVPFWVFKLGLSEDEKVTLRINGVSGEFEDEDVNIPYQGKTTTELAKETLSDLQHPESWLEYLQHFFADVLLLFQPEKEHPNRWVIILVLFAIALFLLALGFVKLPTPQ